MPEDANSEWRMASSRKNDRAPSIRYSLFAIRHLPLLGYIEKGTNECGC
jgi:hypothetical protein